MKTSRISTLLAALACVFTFSSCLDDSEDYGNMFRSYVTITGDNIFGYTFHSDFGCKLIPTSTSIESVLPGLVNSTAKRAYVAFELVGDETTTVLNSGETYDVNLVADPYGYANYAVPTSTTINTQNNPAAIDSIATKNTGNISSINSNIWAANGYANAEFTLLYDSNKTFYLHTYYNAEDVDAANNTLSLNIYYNSNSTNAYTQGQGVFSFQLPSEAYRSFQADTITLILKAKVNQYSGMDNINNELNEVGRCKLATKDLFPPTAY